MPFDDRKVLRVSPIIYKGIDSVQNDGRATPPKSRMPLKIKLPSRLDLPPPVVNDSEGTLDSDCEGSMEMLKPTKFNKNNSTDSIIFRRQSDESLSVRWFSYSVVETDDGSSMTRSYSREMEYTSTDGYYRSSISEGISGGSPMTAESHVWNPSRASYSGSVYSTTNPKTPILRARTSPATKSPSHVVSLKHMAIREKDESPSKSSIEVLRNAMGSPSLIRLPPIVSPQVWCRHEKGRDSEPEILCGLSPHSISQLSFVDEQDDLSSDSASLINSKQDIFSLLLTAEL